MGAIQCGITGETTKTERANWQLMLKWDADSHVTFKPDGYTVHDYEERFALEDNGFIAPNDKFLWDMLKHSQISIDYYTRSDFGG